MKFDIKIYIVSLFIGFVLNGCTEVYVPKTNVYEKALVVECILSNQTSYQKVKLSNVVRLQEEASFMEENAQVWIEDSSANQYIFSEKEPGIYFSNNEFKAENNTKYKLHIKTKTGKKYESRGEYLTQTSKMNNLYAEKVIKNGVEGVQIYIDGEVFDEINYIKYEFEETYKVLTPFSTLNDILMIPNDDPDEYDIIIKESEENQHECYTTKSNKRFILHYTEKSSIQKYPIRFIESEEYMIREGYSILVKQFVQSFDAFNYFKTINTLDNLENLFVENQTGAVIGNIQSKDDTDELVVGFFEVSSLSEKRIFLKYSDFEFERPLYPYTCTLDTFDYRDNTTLDKDRNDRFLMNEFLNVKNPPWELYERYFVLENGEAIPYYVLINPECSNCTSFSSNIKPTFWED